MLERSHRHLTHLSLLTINFPPDQLLRLFSCVPTVAVLDFEESPDSGVYLVLKALIAPLQENELDALDEDNDEVTLNSEDQVHETDGLKLGWDGDDFPAGLSLLPRLKELNLVTRSRNKLLLQLVRSRWKPSSLLVSSDDDSGSEACVCLQTLRVKYPGTRALKRLKALEKSLHKFEKAGMVVEVSK